jgi:hypothetical protein
VVAVSVTGGPSVVGSAVGGSTVTVVVTVAVVVGTTVTVAVVVGTTVTVAVAGVLEGEGPVVRVAIGGREGAGMTQGTHNL